GPLDTPLMLSTGPGAPAPSQSRPGLALPDLDLPIGGPLAGLLAALDSLRARAVISGILITVAVDTPFLPPGFAATMAAELHQAPAAYAAWGDNFYPTNAAWRIESLIDLPTRLRTHSEPRSLRHLLENLGARRVDFASRYPLDPFANINTLPDLLALQRRIPPTCGKLP
ncbi:MAG TPA: NTP transferase domain-containing protein, partial [Devosia sp.]|nr:NTP transferase domain-containing protein [Devosia sp.]